jgi:glucokinase
MGNARVAALDGQHKFFRFRIPTSLHGDAYLFSLAADLLKPGDVAIVISNAGKLPELIKAAETAREAGADVIAIAPSQSPLAKKATVCLAVNHGEDSTLFLSMISRFLQLLFIDILSVGLSLDNQGEKDADAAEGKGTGGHLLISHLDS